MFLRSITLKMIILSVAFIPTSSFASFFKDETAGPIENKVVIKESIPEGVAIKNNQISLKKGYIYERVNKNHVNVLPDKHDEDIEITGSFECSCNGTNKGCEVIISGKHVVCGTTSLCDSMCYMIVSSRNKDKLELSE